MIDLFAAGGKYPGFVWGAYGATALAFAWMIIDSWVRARAARRALERLEREAER